MIAVCLMSLHYFGIHHAGNGVGQDCKERSGAGGFRQIDLYSHGINCLHAVGRETSHFGKQERWRPVDRDHAVERVHHIVGSDRIATGEFISWVKVECQFPMIACILGIPGVSKTGLDRLQIGANERDERLIHIVSDQDAAIFIDDRWI